MSVEGEEIAMPGSWIGDIQWSPNNRHFSFAGVTEIEFYDIEMNKFLDVDIWYAGNRTLTWSPNGRYAPISDSSVVDVIEATKHLYSGQFIGWSEDSQMLYSVSGDRLIQLDVETWRSTDLLELPYAPRYDWFSISPDSNKIMFYDDENYAVYVDLNTLELKTFGNQTNAYNLGWTNDSRYWVYGKLKNKDVYKSIHVYDTVENTSRELNTPINIGRYEVELSPTGRYVKYVREYKADGETPLNYGIYDLEKDVEHIIADSYKSKYWQEWFSHEGEDYFLTYKQVGKDNQQAMTTIMDMEDFSTCKIGNPTQYGLKFQPQG